MIRFILRSLVFYQRSHFVVMLAVAVSTAVIGGALIVGDSVRADPVVNMRNRPFSIAAAGTIEYQYFVVDPKLTEDEWFTAAQIMLGNRSVVHHAILFIRPPDGTEFRGIGWLTAYVPGQRLCSNGLKSKRRGRS